MIYLAGSLFTSAEQQWNSSLANNLRAHRYDVLLPQEFCEDLESPRMIATACLTQLRLSSIIVVNCDGSDMDSGTAMEFGYAIAINKTSIAYRTDFRRAGDCDKNVNLMVAEKADVFIHHPLGSYSEIARSIMGALERWQ